MPKPNLKLEYTDGTKEELTIPGAQEGDTPEQAFIRYCEARDAEAKKTMEILKKDMPWLFE